MWVTLENDCTMKLMAISSLVSAMAHRLFSGNLLPEPIMTYYKSDPSGDISATFGWNTTVTCQHNAFAIAVLYLLDRVTSKPCGIVSSMNMYMGRWGLLRNMISDGTCAMDGTAQSVGTRHGPSNRRRGDRQTSGRLILFIWRQMSGDRFNIP